MKHLKKICIALIMIAFSAATFAQQTIYIDADNWDESTKQALEKAMRELNAAQEKIDRSHYDFPEEKMEKAMRAMEESLALKEMHLREVEAKLALNEAEIERTVEQAMRQVEEQLRGKEGMLRNLEANLKVMEEQIHAWEKNLKNELYEDGLINSRNEKMQFNMHDDYMEVNGRRVEGRLFQKYKKMMDELDFDFDFNFDFNFDNNVRRSREE
ncbi:MAG: hypothetical protein KDD63_02110 [Bacteroidetes bacterium]|nr:hypothetical protein [Bacteroidota bacterium]